MSGSCKKICRQCGTEFIGASASKICPKCKELKPRRKMINVGKTYGFIRVDAIANRSYRCYECHCEKCGNKFVATGSIIFKFSDTGCSKCRHSEAKEMREKEYEEYIGRSFGDLKVIGYSGQKTRCKNSQYQNPFMICECLNCGSITEISLAHLKSGNSKRCRECGQKNLEDGRELLKNYCIDGTLVCAIDGRRKVNKNNTTKYNGVSWAPKLNKYRAYIYFRKKQYSLGVYSDINDAVAARKEAEEQIYGPFLDWYASAYPKQWERVKRKEENTGKNQ